MVALLAIALAAMVLGCLFLILELQLDYQWERKPALLDRPAPMLSLQGSWAAADGFSLDSSRCVLAARDGFASVAT